MAADDRPGDRGPWSGLSYIALGLGSLLLFEFYGNSAAIGEVILCLAFVGVGVTDVLTPWLSPLFDDLNRYWTGLFWALCGLGLVGIAAVSLRSNSRWIGGVVLGGGLVLYGLLAAADR